MSFLPAATHAYLDRARVSLLDAALAADTPTRYATAHVAALRATAALLAARAQPLPDVRRPGSSPRRAARRSGQKSAQKSGQKSAQKSAWVLLAEVAPELGEWATYFAAGASKRAAAEAGARGAVSEREADDLLRDADRFLAVVEQSLGLVAHGGPQRGRSDVA